MRTHRIGRLPLGVPPLWVERTACVSDALGEREVLHVMSALAGGQIAGYWRPCGDQGPYRCQAPWYGGLWSELHQAVADLVRVPIEVGRRMTSGTVDYSGVTHLVTPKPGPRQGELL